MATGICAQCKHFRRVKPASQLLSSVISTTDAGVSEALTQIVQDEQKQRDAEAEYKRLQAGGDNNMWPMPPVMSDYCAFDDGVPRIAEIKNFGLRCKDFSPGKSRRLSCSDCHHRIAPTWPEQDIATETSLNSMATSGILVGVGAGNADNLLNTHRQGVVARKAFELSSIYSTKGVLSIKPKYFDYCGAFSRDDEFVVCALANRYHTCSSWNVEVTQAAQLAAPGVSTTRPTESAMREAILEGSPPMESLASTSQRVNEVHQGRVIGDVIEVTKLLKGDRVAHPDPAAAYELEVNSDDTFYVIPASSSSIVDWTKIHAENIPEDRWDVLVEESWDGQRLGTIRTRLPIVAKRSGSRLFIQWVHLEVDESTPSTGEHPTTPTKTDLDGERPHPYPPPDGGGSVYSRSLDQFVSAQEAEEKELMKTNPELARMKKLQNQQERAKFIEDMADMMRENGRRISSIGD